MFGHDFDFEIIEKITYTVGSLFKDLRVIRKDSNGDITKIIQVPLLYGPKEKYYYRVIQEPDLEKKKEIVIPRMSFRISSFNYDSARKGQTMITNIKSTETGANIQYNPVPWNIGYELCLIVRNAKDGTQLIGQILPYFTPDYTLKINSIVDMGFKDNIPLVLGGVNLEDTYEGSLASDRDIIWTLNFTAKALLYGPIREQGLIRRVQVDLLVPPSGGPVTDEEVANTPRSVRITTEPDPLDALPSEEYSYTTDIEDFFDNKKFNPVSLEDEDI